jgi:branched-chain amino acid aminotransferase
VFAYVNGAMVDETAAGVAIFDHGFIVGDGVFETISLRHGVAYGVTLHLARLGRSAAGLGLPPPDLDELHEAVGHTIAANPGIEWGALRVTYTSGPGGFGSSRGDLDGTTTVVAPRELPRPTPVTDVITVPWPRNERGALAGLKTTSYAENAKALAEAHRQGASEAIFGNTAGHLCEGSGTNVFLGLGGVLVTPPLSAGCLAGITRGLLLEKCALDAQERDVPLEALYQAEEAFLTSATRDVQPVRAVDGRLVAGCPGPLTSAAARAYAALLATDPDPV